MISISLFFTFCERFLKLRYNVILVTSELSILNEDDLPLVLKNKMTD
jgi:hypothetical protein